MTIALLDTNDCNLQLWGAGTRVQSPGYALLTGNSYRFGQEARNSARLRPRDINNRFWWQLGTEPLQPTLGPARHSADLVHAHLLQVHEAAGQPAELLLSCSGTMQREQLSLLLGISEQCPFTAVGLVNRSVLLGSLYGGSGRLFHLEVQLHQAVVTQLSRNSNEVTVERSVPLPGCGLLALQERLVEVAASAFIRQTRFDPRRKADTEQMLYDALPAALQVLNEKPETNIEINGYRARLLAADMTAAGQRLFTAAADIIGAPQAADRVLAEPLAALLPGLRNSFTDLAIANADDLWQATQQHGERLIHRDGPLHFISALPSLSSGHGDAIEPAFIPAIPAARPSHLLRGAIASPLKDNMILHQGTRLADTPSGWTIAGNAMVNGAACEAGTLLAAGDRIELEDGEGLLIEVQP